ncbi:unnamed protein product [Schistocephalus solidus]|uniref:Uncharacterized protein n=1 Tax=Schistocephalus solidus TaxID=70667 RepID=A0A183T633_SCHSO|nr:unnamed protein product [Schistocephalus solidus]
MERPNAICVVLPLTSTPYTPANQLSIQPQTSFAHCQRQFCARIDHVGQRRVKYTISMVTLQFLGKSFLFLLLLLFILIIIIISFFFFFFFFFPFSRHKSYQTLRTVLLSCKPPPPPPPPPPPSSFPPLAMRAQPQAAPTVIAHSHHPSVWSVS